MSRPTKGRTPVREPNRTAAPAGRQPGAGRNSPSREEARRAQIARRKKALRRRRFAFGVALFLIAAAVGIILSLTVFFKIESIQVTGETRYSPEEIVAASGIQSQQNLFLMNSAEAGEAVKRELPYVYDVTVKRELPGTVHIEVTKAQVAYAVKQEDKTFVLLDDRCKVLEANAEKAPADAAALNGVTLTGAQPGSSAVFQQDYAAELLKAVSAAARAEEFTGLTSFDLKDRNQLWATYQNRIRLQLGGSSDLDYKFRFAKRSIARLDETNPGAKGTLNLTVKKNAYWLEDSNTK